LCERLDGSVEHVGFPDWRNEEPAENYLSDTGSARLRGRGMITACDIASSQDKKLFSVQFQSGAMQKAVWNDRLYRRVLLCASIAPPVARRYAGSPGAPWNGFDRTDLSLSLFEVRGDGELTLLQ
jgi:hypothetical protein